MSGPEGKTLREIDEKIADYDRKVKESRMQAMHYHYYHFEVSITTITTHV